MAIRSFSKYVRKAEKKLAQLENNQSLRPVIIEGSVIAKRKSGQVLKYKKLPFQSATHDPLRLE
jgi:hypothetical protein